MSLCAFLSGSGGVGKTTIAVALARQAARNGEKTLYLDASGRSRTADLLLGIENQVSFTLSDMNSGLMQEEVLCPVSLHLSYLPLDFFHILPLSEFSDCLHTLKNQFSLIIIDLCPGIHPDLPFILDAEDSAILVTRGDNAGMRAAESVAEDMSKFVCNRQAVLNFVPSFQKEDERMLMSMLAEQVLDMPVSGILARLDNADLAALIEPAGLSGQVRFAMLGNTILRNLRKA